MPKDYANIYNLSDEEFELEKQNLWKDAIPGTIDLANNLLRKIGSDEYPYVLSVEAFYGMGKTYFFSRFCEYAKINGFNCIYISAWENDYQPSPFCFITKEILNYLETSFSSSTKSIITELKSKAIEVTKKVLSSSNLHIGFNTGLFSAGIDTNLDKLCANFLEKKDEIKEFKRELTKLLTENKIKPLMIIVDELDRCRPDYALKTLEIIKHFFDISNLYIILPLNKEAIERAVESTYGKMTNSENYIRKLITEAYILPASSEEDYKKIVKTHIPKEKLKKIIKNKFIEMNDNFNGFNTLIESISKYAFSGKLTYREVTKVCNEFICIANNFNKKIMIEYLAYKLCYKYKPKNVSLNTAHPFYSSSYGEDFRKKTISINGLRSLTYNLYQHLEYTRFEKSYREEVKLWEVNKDDFESYESFYRYIDNILNIKEIILKCEMRTYKGAETFKKLFDTLETAKANALDYQRKYGSTDNDKEENIYYDKIIENSLCLYEKAKTKK